LFAFTSPCPCQMPENAPSMQTSPHSFNRGAWGLLFIPCLPSFVTFHVPCNTSEHLTRNNSTRRTQQSNIPRNHLLLDSAPNIGPLISRWELDKFRNCWNKSFRTSKILTLLYHQFSNFLISQRVMSGPRLGTLSNNRWSGGTEERKPRVQGMKWLEYQATFLAYLEILECLVEVARKLSKDLFLILVHWGLSTALGSFTSNDVKKSVSIALTNTAPRTTRRASWSPVSFAICLLLFFVKRSRGMVEFSKAWRREWWGMLLWNGWTKWMDCFATALSDLFTLRGGPKSPAVGFFF
jgi:hypothetical protein